MQALNYIPIDGIKVGDRIEVYTNYEDYFTGEVVSIDAKEFRVTFKADEDKVLRQYQQERHEENLRRYSELEKTS